MAFGGGRQDYQAVLFSCVGRGVRKISTLAIAAGLAALVLAPSLGHAQSFSNDDRSCSQYGAWAVSIILLAQSQGCDVKRNNEWLDPNKHAGWCRGQSLATMMKAPEVHRTGVAYRCAKQGVTVNLGAAKPAAAAPAPSPKAIRILNATYGASCGVPAGNAIRDMAARCNGKASCTYTVSYRVLGDPAPNCKKDFRAKFSCGGNMSFDAFAPAEAGYESKVVLACR